MNWRMKNKIFTTPRFVSRFMRLSKKFRLLENDVENLEEKLILTPKLGERHQTLRNWHLIKKAFALKILTYYETINFSETPICAVWLWSFIHQYKSCVYLSYNILCHHRIFRIREEKSKIIYNFFSH